MTENKYFWQGGRLKSPQKIGKEAVTVEYDFFRSSAIVIELGKLEFVLKYGFLVEFYYFIKLF